MSFLLRGLEHLTNALIHHHPNAQELTDAVEKQLAALKIAIEESETKH